MIAGEMPARLQAALAMTETLAASGIYFAPIRHHSPACAYAVRAQIEALQPAHILIEAPSNFDPMIPVLLDSRTRPPIAILSQAVITRRIDTAMPSAPADHDAVAIPASESPPQTETRSAFFPFCDYSPEWVALQTGRKLGAALAFIDLPWQQQAEHEAASLEPIDPDVDPLNATHDQLNLRSLQAERYLAHSRYIAALSARMHCRDHDELWDHLFELRPTVELADWQDFFQDTLVWSGMARLDYEEAVLAREGSLIREQHMVSRILAACAARQVQDLRHDAHRSPIIIVTGAFHTLALVETLHTALQTAQHDTEAARQSISTTQPSDTTSWLIRYSFDRLDALNGYASGMPTPAYYQMVWEALQPGAKPDSRQQVNVKLLSQIAAATRLEHYPDPITFASVQSAASQASQLAMLRQHPVIARYDLLDAVTSCYIKGSMDDGQHGFFKLVRGVLSGARLGDIPPATTAPPLVESVRRQALMHRLKLDDTISRRTRLDLYRKPAHRARSRFLHLMRFLDIGFASHLAGPDYLAGTDLDLLFEEWDYAWSPLIEARLIDLSSEGTSLDEIALKRILQQESQLEAAGQGRSAQRAVSLLTNAAVIGMQMHLPRLFTLLESHLQGDSELASVMACGLKLLQLWRGREFLGLTQHQALLPLIRQILPAALFLLPRLQTIDEHQEQAAIASLLSLREFTRLGEAILDMDDSDPPRLQLGRALERLLSIGNDHLSAQASLPAGLMGAIEAILFIDGLRPESMLDSQLKAHFGIGADPQQAVRYLSGLMQAAPELLVQTETLARALNHLLSVWQEHTFVAHLPDLRLAFTHLKPRETASFAERIAQWNGLSVASLSQHHTEISQTDLLQGTQLQLALMASLAQDGLADWYGSGGTGA